MYQVAAEEAGATSKEYIVPKFMKPVSREILLTGKSLNLIRQIEKGGSFLFSSSSSSSKSSSIIPLEKEADARNDAAKYQHRVDLIPSVRNTLSELLDFQWDSSHNPLVGTVLESFFKVCLSSSIDGTLLRQIRERYKRTNGYLVSLMLNECKLTYHLKNLRRYYLCEAGDVMHDFATKIFEKVKRRNLLVRGTGGRGSRALPNISP